MNKDNNDDDDGCGWTMEEYSDMGGSIMIIIIICGIIIAVLEWLS